MSFPTGPLFQFRNEQDRAMASRKAGLIAPNIAPGPIYGTDVSGAVNDFSATSDGVPRFNMDGEQFLIWLRKQGYDVDPNELQKFMQSQASFQKNLNYPPAGVAIDKFTPSRTDIQNFNNSQQSDW